MKTDTSRLTMMALLAAALSALTACSSNSTPPVGSGVVTYTKGVPGGVLVQTVKMSATVTAIDQAKRKATLLRSDGKKSTVQVAPEAVNFAEIRVGDRVTATVTQKIIMSLDNKAGPTGEGASPATSNPPAEMVQMTAKVIAIDLEKRTATLQFDDGPTETFPVRSDVDLSRRKVGEQVVFRLTEMIAVWIEKATEAKDL